MPNSTASKNATFLIRPVTPADAAAVRQIYTPYVTESMISFETEVPSLGEIEQRIRTISRAHPWLVAVQDGAVVAYAYAAVFKARAAYDLTVETSVYVDTNLKSQGLGTKIYEALLAELQQKGFAQAIALISLPNEPSVLFHEKLNFKMAGRLVKVGFKFDQWWDIGYWQLSLR
jgi:L-amino acid N-acyltransferase YncA